MSSPKKILIQLDTDGQCSTFDSVVAVDAGSEVLLRHSNVTESEVTGLVHGAMFTRSTRKLASTAIFVGGSDVPLAEAIYAKACSTFFGDVRVSVAMDASGCNTTSAAAVKLALDRLSKLSNVSESPDKVPHSALVLGATGAVGQRVAQLLSEAGLDVICHSRSLDKAANIAQRISTLVAGSTDGSAQPTGKLTASDLQTSQLVQQACGCQIVINAGAAGVQFFDQQGMKTLQDSPGVLVDLNAVPPAGFAGLNPHQELEMGQRIGLGALVVGDLKMKLHRQLIQQCFESNDRQFALREIYQLLKAL